MPQIFRVACPRRLPAHHRPAAKYLTAIASITAERADLAGKIKTALDGAAFGNAPVSEGSEDGLGRRARSLIDRVEDLADRSLDDDHRHEHFGE